MTEMTCPKCGGALRTHRRNQVTIEQCRKCHGIFLDRGELEQLIGAESSFLGRDGALQPTERRPEPAPRALIEFPADESERALRFWNGLLGIDLAPRSGDAGAGWEVEEDGLRIGVHERGRGPGDTASLPYLPVAEMSAALERVEQLGGSVIHPGERWSICRDSEGSPFALELS